MVLHLLFVATRDFSWLIERWIRVRSHALGCPLHINDKAFLNTVRSLANDGVKISNVLDFNEPEKSGHGGSNSSPAYGAQFG